MFHTCKIRDVYGKQKKYHLKLTIKRDKCDKCGVINVGDNRCQVVVPCLVKSIRGLESDIEKTKRNIKMLWLLIVVLWVIFFTIWIKSFEGDIGKQKSAILKLNYWHLKLIQISAISNLYLFHTQGFVS